MSWREISSQRYVSTLQAIAPYPSIAFTVSVGDLHPDPVAVYDLSFFWSMLFFV